MNRNFTALNVAALIYPNLTSFLAGSVVIAESHSEMAGAGITGFIIAKTVARIWMSGACKFFRAAKKFALRF
jgi:hypothetical protein